MITVFIEKSRSPYVDVLLDKGQFRKRCIKYICQPCVSVDRSVSKSNKICNPWFDYSTNLFLTGYHHFRITI